MAITTAFVLAGGEGIRLRPLTDNLPKNLVPVAGKPLAEHTVELLEKNRVKRVIFAVGYKKEMMKEHFANWQGAEILFSEENEPLGTAGCLTLAKQYLKERFVMMNGDVLTKLSLADMVAFHEKNNAAITIALAPVEDPRRFGVAELEGDRITKFLEKPENPPTYLINAVIYIIEPEVLENITAPSSIERDVFPVCVDKEKVYGYVLDSYWIDIGTMESLKKAEELIK